MCTVTVQHEKWSEAGKILAVADALCEKIKEEVMLLIGGASAGTVTDTYDVRKRIESIVEEDPAAAVAVYGLRVIREGDAVPLFECPSDTNLLTECGNPKSWRRSYRTRYTPTYTSQYQSSTYSSTNRSSRMCGSQMMVGDDDPEGESLEDYFTRMGLIDPA